MVFFGFAGFKHPEQVMMMMIGLVVVVTTTTIRDKML